MKSFEEDYNDCFNNVFDGITYDDDPKQVKTVSMLRHYINCHGVTQKLLDNFGLKKGKILNKIRDYCYGGMNVREILNNPEKIEECKAERDARDLALMKNEELAWQLSQKRVTFCGLGIRRIKLFLNKLVKQGDKVAEMYRIALETEDENIKAKDNWYYADAHYNRKRELINRLIDLCEENNVEYGIQDSDVRDTSHVIYFELPNCKQISFHNSFDEADDLPIYTKEWDGIKNSTLPKIEQAILEHYPEEIKKLIEKYEKKDNEKKSLKNIC